MHYNNFIRYATAATFLFFYVTVSYGSGCSKSNTCKTCTAKNSYGNVIEEKQVCTQQEEQSFRDHYALAQTPVTVTCQ
ncbi:MAG: hypothetical protein ACT4OJ_03715 [Bacteroidota bacterium]